MIALEGDFYFEEFNEKPHLKVMLVVVSRECI